jgi:NADPH:quinone reductase-like Zn-dependent oxidoreductase
MEAIQINQYGGEGLLKMVEVPQPKAGKAQIVVRVLATSFNPIDRKRTSGEMKQIVPLHFPFVPGGDFSGVVDSIGEGVQGFQVGEDVFGYAPDGGAYAEYIAVDADRVAAKPRTLNYVDAAAVAMVSQTALQMLERAGVQKGQTVLIQGGGGAVGGIAVQAAHRLGAKVIATATGPEIQRVKDYGADEVIDYKAERFENRAKNVDAVLDAVGGEVLQRSFAVLKPGGVLVTIVQPPSEEEAAKHKVKASMLLTEVKSDGLKKLAQMVDAGEIKPYVGKTYPLREVVRGWEAARSGQVDGKIVFRVGAEAGRSAGAQ